MVSLLVDDPAVTLHGNEPMLLDGRWIGYVRAAAYGHTLGGAVGLAMVHHDAGVSDEWLAAQSFQVWTPQGARGVRLSVQPWYDPKRVRVLA